MQQCVLTDTCTHTSCAVLCRYVDEVNLLDDGLVDVVLDSGARSWLAAIAVAQLAGSHCCCSVGFGCKAAAGVLLTSWAMVCLVDAPGVCV